MIKKVRNTILTLAITIVASLNLNASPADSTEVFNGSTYAVIIGISDYLNVRDLQYAHKDANAFSEYLQSKAGGEVPAENIKIYLNEEASAFNIGDAFIWINQVAFDGDRVIIFFAGHGDVEALNEVENGLLLLHKAPSSSYFAFGNDYLPVYEVKKFMKTLTNKNVDAILITDACRSGKLAGGLQGNEKTSKALSKSWTKEVKILSCQPDELSQEGAQWGGGRGVFSYHLIQGLKGLADQNHDGKVNVGEIEEYLITNVTKETEPAAQTPSAVGEKDYVLSFVDKETLANLSQEKENEYQLFASVNMKGFQKSWFDENDSTIYFHYSKFEKAIMKGNLLKPEEASAYYHYKAIQKYDEVTDIQRLMQRNLAAALQEEAMKIIVPVLEGQKVAVDAADIQEAAFGLEKAIELLGSEHYMANSLRARKEFLDAAALTFYLEGTSDSSQYYSYVSKIINSLQKSIDLEPNAAYAYYGMAYICDKGKKYNKALKAYKTYLSYVPNNAAAYNSIANIYIETKDFKRALYYSDKALEIDSTYSEAYYNLGRATLSLGYYKESLENFRNALKYNLKSEINSDESSKEKAQLFIDKANTYSSKKQYKHAIKNYRKAIGLKLKDRIVLLLKGNES